MRLKWILIFFFLIMISAGIIIFVLLKQTEQKKKISIPPSPTICAQVITTAKNIKTGECKDFPTPCDVPEGWEKVVSCVEKVNKKITP